MQLSHKQVSIDQYGFHLLRNFVLAGLVSIVIVIVVLSTLMYNAAVDSMVNVTEDKNKTLARALANHAWEDKGKKLQALVASSPDSVKESLAYQELLTDVYQHTDTSQMASVRIYSRDMQILFSTDVSQLGQFQKANPLLMSALAGELRTVKDFEENISSADEEPADEYWVRTYMPFKDDLQHNNEVTSAIIEVSSNVTDMHEHVLSTRNKAVVSIALVLLIVFSILFVFVRRASLIASRRLEEKLEDEATMRHIAYHDALTGLPNREMFRHRLEGAVARTARNDSLLAVIFLDLDRFKHINDTLGHTAGDLLLKEVAVRLTDCVRQTDTVGRQGGDEFTLLLDNITHVDEVEIVTNRILDALAVPICLDGHDVMTTASMGISIYPLDERDMDHLLKDADLAMYAAKDAGRNNYVFYSSDMSKDNTENLEMESKLRTALEEDEYLLQYQPIVDVRKGEMVGVEALLRWNNQEYGIVGPDKFIPILEETGFIVIVGDWVLNTACRKAMEWQQLGYAPITMSVNISIVQFRRIQFVESVQNALTNSGLDPQYLKIEITESVLMDQNDASIRKLQAIRDMGVSIAADDFGTGYSSLSYLRKLPIDILKIDRSFVMDIHKSQDGAAITTAIAALAHSLKLGIIAEGVEEIEELNFLVALSCNYIQGYFFSRPLFEEDLLLVMDDKDYFMNKLIAAREQNQAAHG